MTTTQETGSRITLIQYPGLTRETTLSPPCGKVHMALRFKGLDYDTLSLDTPMQVRRYNARGRVPVLRIGERLICDSSDIVSELERLWPDPPLEPGQPVAWARAQILEDWADEHLYFLGIFLRWRREDCYRRMRERVLRRLPVPARWIVPTIARREVARRANSQGVGLKDEATVLREWRAALDQIEALLTEAPFLVGAEPTRADLAVATVLDQLDLPEWTPDLSEEIGRRGELAAWLARVHERAPRAT